jgi:hypothetical protein
MAATLNDVADEQRRLTAHHEAGHTVAAMLRGGGEVVSITIDADTATRCAGSAAIGHIHFRVKACDEEFVTYAGPWAKARAQWHEPTLDAEDDDGYVFADYVSGAFLYNSDGDLADLTRLRADLRRLWADPSQFATAVKAAEAVWSHELERRWPVIEAVAAMLGAGATVTPDAVADLIEEAQP